MSSDVDVKALATSLASLLESENNDHLDSNALTRRSFQIVSEHAAGLPGPDKALVWREMARRIHWLVPGWNASGPHELGDGAVAYWGGFPKGYVVIFRRDGDVFFTRSRTSPQTSWIPSYESLQTLGDYLAAPPQPPRSPASP